MFSLIARKKCDSRLRRVQYDIADNRYLIADSAVLNTDVLKWDVGRAFQLSGYPFYHRLRMKHFGYRIIGLSAMACAGRDATQH